MNVEKEAGGYSRGCVSDEGVRTSVARLLMNVWWIAFS
jgi:hypothetical protein